MLIPYWFGHWPKKFPWMISILAVLMIFITQFYAHRIRAAERSFAKKTLGISSSISKLRLQVQYKYCSLIYAKNENFCTFVRSKTAELLNNESNQMSSHQMSSNQVGRQNKKSSVKMNLMWLQYVSMINKNPQDWPVQLKASSEYGEIVELEARIKQIATEGFDGVGMVSGRNWGIRSVLVASFNHHGLKHLISNLFILIIVGIWVEQRVGFFRTLVIFLLGSFFSITGSIFFSPGVSIVGASGGIAAISGAFYLLFLKSRFKVIFWIPIMVRGQLFLPTLFVFPFVFILNDVINLKNNDGVAHVAHLFGFLGGCLIGWAIKQKTSLHDGAFFEEENQLILDLKNHSKLEGLWDRFYQIYQWNNQNRECEKIFLRKVKDLGWTPRNLFEKKIYREVLEESTLQTFRYCDRETILDWCRCSIPNFERTGVDIFKKIPITQVLFISDTFAKQGEFREADYLYRTTLKRVDSQSGEVQRKILSAIEEIKRISVVEESKQRAAG